jgi:hypothetical protein
MEAHVYCDSCGKPLRHQAQFCSSCGVAVDPSFHLGFDAADAAASAPDGADEQDEPHWGPSLPRLHWPEWSPRRIRDPENADLGEVTVDVDRVVWAWRCDGCGSSSNDAQDFERIHGDPLHRRCPCGETVERTPAVFCGSCDTLILLRNTDPDID